MATPGGIFARGVRFSTRSQPNLLLELVIYKRRR